jgi:signal transduction histidine kinase
MSSRPSNLHADQMRLRQALLNLMSNANKFTEKGTVTIAVRQGQENGREWITLSVADTAYGQKLKRAKDVGQGAAVDFWATS